MSLNELFGDDTAWGAISVLPISKSLSGYSHSLCHLALSNAGILAGSSDSFGPISFFLCNHSLGLSDFWYPRHHSFLIGYR